MAGLRTPISAMLVLTGACCRHTAAAGLNVSGSVRVRRNNAEEPKPGDRRETAWQWRDEQEEGSITINRNMAVLYERVAADVTWCARLLEGATDAFAKASDKAKSGIVLLTCRCESQVIQTHWSSQRRAAYLRRRGWVGSNALDTGGGR